MLAALIVRVDQEGNSMRGGNLVYREALHNRKSELPMAVRAFKFEAFGATMVEGCYSSSP